MCRTFSFFFPTARAAWDACPKNVINVSVRPTGDGRFELRYDL